MENILNLEFPTVSLISPFASQIQEHTTEWAKQFSLINEDKTRFFNKAKFGFYAAREYPEAGYDDLCIVGDLIAWLFTVDDQCDRASSNSMEAAVLREMLTGFISIIRKGGLTFTSSLHQVLNESLQDIMFRFKSVSTPYLYQQFGDYMVMYFEECLWEIDMQVNGYEPSIREYLEQRPKTGFYIMFPLISIFKGVQLPEEVYNHPVLKEIELLLNLTANLANDLHSLEREKALKTKGLNLVFIYQRELQISLDDAITEIREQYHRNLSTMDDLRLQFPHWSSTVNRQLEEYIDGLYTVIKAYFDWAIVDTARYQS
ncbi:MAG: hypothetical protein JO154_05910 [Chitinophaga sp.]|uniref:terpene synthase family protein n=1 Tax=Chitinophaga sp. TaxID=1869181 RepID=UPI0025C22171|nr:hypothetical protein [Chitinophaga sp.]MBV8252125.1 hypothetical protein [Chitinophaga sp.]